MSKRKYRGISSSVLAFVMSIALLLVLTYVFLSTTSLTQIELTGFKSILHYSSVHQLYSLVVTERSIDKVYLFNSGISDIIIDKVVVVTPNNILLVLEPLEVCNSSIIPVQSSIWCDATYEYIAVLTIDGVVLYPRVPVEKATLKYSEAYIIPVLFNFTTIETLEELFDVDPDLIVYPYPGSRDAKGVTGYKVLRVPPGYSFEENVSVQTDIPGVAFGVVVIGYDPLWIMENTINPGTPPRFRILISSPGFTGREKLRIGDRAAPVTGLGERILIVGFTGTIKIYSGNISGYIACSSSNPTECSDIDKSAIGFWYYGYTDSKLKLRLYLNGFAVNVSYFQRMSRGGDVQESSYYPYLYIGDVDGNGIIDFVFTTEDAYYGSFDRINDYYNKNDLSDWSTEPIVLKLLQIGRALGEPDGSVNGSVYSGILLYLNIFFHDNSHPDVNQLNDIDRTDWVLRILLVDQNGNTYTVREFRYQEICNYHKTRITDFNSDNYFVKISNALYIPIPGGGKYWVIIAFQDPYASGKSNDADLTIGVEIIGVIPFYRQT